MRYRQWLVVINSCVVAFINVGLQISLGALFHSISEKFKANRPATALVQSLSFGSMVIGVVVGSLVDKYGLWRVSFIGTMCTVAGLGGGFFATSICHLYILSIVSGVGITIMGLCTIVGIETFTEGQAQSIALAINSSCMGLGGLVYPHLLVFLEATYGLNGTYLILAGVFCNNVIFVLATINLCSSTPVIVTSNIDSHSLNTIDRNNTNDYVFAKHKTLCRVTFLYNIQAKLLRITSTPYVLTWIATAAILSATDGYLATCVDIYTSMGFTEQQGITTMTFYQIGNIFAGFLSVVFKQFKSISTFAIPFIFSICGSIGITLAYFAVFVEVVYAGSCLIGLSEGVLTGILLILVEIVPTDLYGIAFGIILTSFSLLSFAAGPINGALRDATGSYAVSFLVIWITLFLSGFLFVIAGVIQRKYSVRTAPHPDVGGVQLDTMSMSTSKSTHM